ncbi:MAG TPA: hypothetical protein VGI77_02455 [Gaiellaceae bacterium]
MSVGPDREVVELLREDPDLLAIADAVVATQAPKPTSHAWRLLAVAALVGAAIVLAIVAPWHGHGNGLVGRALAAVGQGAVLHAVIESEVPNEKIVTLSSGRARPVPQSLEYWYAADRRLLRAISSVNGGVVVDALVRQDRTEPLLDPALTAFVSRYRAALKSGEAREVGRGTFDGRSVVWLRFEYRVFGERVGIDAQTYRPVVIEPLGPRGKPVAPIWTVTEIGTGPYRASDFKARKLVASLNISSHLQAIAPTKAARLLGWAPVWLGRSFRSLPLQYTQLQVLSHDPPVPRRTTKGVYLAYGRGADRIQISEAKAREPIYWPHPLGAPAPGTALLLRAPVNGPGQRIRRACQAQVHVAGVWVTVEGWNQAAPLCIDAARALVRLEP